MNSIQNEQCSVESMICDEGQSIADKEQLSFSINSTEDKQYSVSESFDLNEKQDVINEEHQTATKVKIIILITMLLNITMYTNFDVSCSFVETNSNFVFSWH